MTRRTYPLPRFVPILKGRKTITGAIEMFWVESAQAWCTLPTSRWLTPDQIP